MGVHPYSWRVITREGWSGDPIPDSELSTLERYYARNHEVTYIPMLSAFLLYIVASPICIAVLDRPTVGYPIEV